MPPPRILGAWPAEALARIPEDALTEDQQRQLHKGMAELLDSMKSRPDDMSAHYNLGNLHMARRRMLEAVAEFETASRLQPDAVPPLVNAVLAYNALGQNDKAEACLRRALRLDSTNAVANLNLGMLLAELGKMTEAELAFRAAFKADPHSAQAAYNLGVLLSKDPPDEAIAWCERAARLGPDNPRYGYTHAFYLFRAGWLDQAIQAIHQVRERFPSHQDGAVLERTMLREREQKRERGNAQTP